MAIRDEVNELRDALVGFGGLIVDDVPNKEQLDDFVLKMFSIITESVDFKDIPREKRKKAIALAFILAAGGISNAAIKFSDEIVPEPPV